MMARNYGSDMLTNNVELCLQDSQNLFFDRSGPLVVVDLKKTEIFIQNKY